LQSSPISLELEPYIPRNRGNQLKCLPPNLTPPCGVLPLLVYSLTRLIEPHMFPSTLAIIPLFIMPPLAKISSRMCAYSCCRGLTARLPMSIGPERITSIADRWLHRPRRAGAAPIVCIPVCVSRLRRVEIREVRVVSIPACAPRISVARGYVRAEHTTTTRVALRTSHR